MYEEHLITDPADDDGLMSMPKESVPMSLAEPLPEAPSSDRVKAEIVGAVLIVCLKKPVPYLRASDVRTIGKINEDVET